MILAHFASDAALTRAVDRFGAARIPVETYSPAPRQGASEASPIPALILIAGLIGLVASFGMQAYTSLVSYPLNIGNRTNFPWASFIPTVFENAVLIAIATGFFAFFIVNRMPRLYDPVDEFDGLRASTDDAWMLHVPGEDAHVAARSRTMLRELGASRIEERRE